MKKAISVILFITLALCSLQLSAFAESFVPEADTADADVLYLYNLENSLTMSSVGLEKIISPSATVKMMTACVALESGIDLQRSVTVTEDMIDGVSGRKMNLKAGDRLSITDLLYATVCGGYNDAATVLALSVCSSLTDFISKMNERARELDMSLTVYSNVTGLDQSGAQTCGADLIRLAKHMILNEEYLKIASAVSYTLSPSAKCDTKKIYNRSSLPASYHGLANLSSGSGYGGDCAISYFKSGELSFLCIVMNASPKDDDDTANYAEYFSKQLLNHALNDYSYKTVLDTDALVASFPVAYASLSGDVGVYLKEPVFVYVPKDIDVTSDLTYNYYLYGDGLSAPLRAGDAVGEMIVSLDGRVLAKATLTVAQDIERNGFLYFLDLIRSYILSRAFLFSCIAFAAISAGYYLYKKRQLRSIHRNSSHYK